MSERVSGGGRGAKPPCGFTPQESKMRSSSPPESERARGRASERPQSSRTHRVDRTVHPLQATRVLLDRAKLLLQALEAQLVGRARRARGALLLTRGHGNVSKFFSRETFFSRPVGCLLIQTHTGMVAGEHIPLLRATTALVSPSPSPTDPDPDPPRRARARARAPPTTSQSSVPAAATKASISNVGYDTVRRLARDVRPVEAARVRQRPLGLRFFPAVAHREPRCGRVGAQRGQRALGVLSQHPSIDACKQGKERKG